MTKTRRPSGRRDFPECPQCPYLHQSLESVCADCAAEQFTSITDPCPFCSQQLEGSQCRNRLCTGQAGDRHLERIEAITLYKEPLKSVMERFKYEGKSGWAQIFARLLVGHLEKGWHPNQIDLIVGNPQNPDRTHISSVLAHANRYDMHNRWPFDPANDPAIIKKTSTPRSAGRSFDAKQNAAESHAAAIEFRLPGRIRSKRIMVYDDICTTGLQLNAVAGQLRRWGAVSVHGVVLARQPWQPPGTVA